MQNEKEVCLVDTGSIMWPRPLTPAKTLTWDFSTLNFEIVSLFQELLVWLVWKKESKSIGYLTKDVTLPFDHTNYLGLKFSRLKFEVAQSQE